MNQFWVKRIESVEMIHTEWKPFRLEPRDRTGKGGLTSIVLITESVTGGIYCEGKFVSRLKFQQTAIGG
jgi:hypothetical protein